MDERYDLPLHGSGSIVLAEGRVSPTSYEEARTRVNSAAIAGTFMLNSDDLYDSTVQSRAISLLTDPEINALTHKGKAFRPYEGDSGSYAPDTWILNDNGTYYIALFNFSKLSSAGRSVNLARAGLCGGASSRGILSD